jgi:hypothetical protein
MCSTHNYVPELQRENHDGTSIAAAASTADRSTGGSERRDVEASVPASAAFVANCSQRS